MLTFQSWTSFSIIPTKSWVGFPDGVMHWDFGTGDLWSGRMEEDGGGSVVLLPMFLVVTFQIWKYILTRTDLLGHSGQNDCFAVSV